MLQVKILNIMLYTEFNISLRRRDANYLQMDTQIPNFNNLCHGIADLQASRKKIMSKTTYSILII